MRSRISGDWPCYAPRGAHDLTLWTLINKKGDTASLAFLELEEVNVGVFQTNFQPRLRLRHLLPNIFLSSLRTYLFYWYLHGSSLSCVDFWCCSGIQRSSH